METKEKLEKLKEILQQQGRLAVAFSGGVDSTFLLAFAHETLGAADSPEKKKHLHRAL